MLVSVHARFFVLVFRWMAGLDATALGLIVSGKSEFNLKCRCCYALGFCMLTEVMSFNCIGPFKNDAVCMLKIKEVFSDFKINKKG